MGSVIDSLWTLAQAIVTGLGIGVARWWMEQRSAKAKAGPRDADLADEVQSDDARPGREVSTSPSVPDNAIALLAWLKVHLPSVVATCLVVLLVLLLLPSILDQLNRPRAQIVDPVDGDELTAGQMIIASGTAENIPADRRLWIVTQVRDASEALDGFYPVGEAINVPIGGEWSLLLPPGTNSVADAGLQVDEVLVLVSEGDSQGFVECARMRCKKAQLPIGARLMDRVAVSLGARSPEPVSPEPVSPEPVSPEPVSPEPVSPEPVSPEPVSPEPVSPEPVSPEPVPPVEVPSLVGMAEADARALLEALGFVPKRSQEEVAVYALGYVAYQEPAAGDRVEPGSTIHYVVSAGMGSPDAVASEGG